ncbi:WbqC family protein [Leclercia sp.]|uniref:WbqC family protein n=1 Tax=Leclercia sp. TaxID=1898428 RepID=UPI0028A62BA7|nr:WbqC family protein [Leclercia sp.]
MNISIMQPYLFPWVGYFQLIAQSDTFVLYDDASFIKQGYINRNSILSDGQVQRFTVPVPGASIHKRIGELCFSSEVGKILKMLKQSYSKAKYFQDVMPMIESVFILRDRDITACCETAINGIFEYLGKEKNIIRSSSLDYDRSQNAENKVLDICRALMATKYVNSIGGRQLYNSENFAAKGVVLKFLQTKMISYYQGCYDFVPNLSIIDVLMHCDPKTVKHIFNSFDYVD